MHLYQVVRHTRIASPSLNSVPFPAFLTTPLTSYPTGAGRVAQSPRATRRCWSLGNALRQLTPIRVIRPISRSTPNADFRYGPIGGSYVCGGQIDVVQCIWTHERRTRRSFTHQIQQRSELRSKRGLKG
ncbi:hypothetical protein CALVIDRAFT_61067 [Calocera viscosa TUFC12733]|uniref:Uncharacterized protein n=1 Tax=Calocera viscosa (strain TUFC12733) TaxID=1330018 RepID=A0A167NKZ7_CALVF|nr:hypothetical protein CALVIDRAFT_60920 [Calocera viscosa TUFC12733]KZO97823.1 hypothetical protein CALVIDRAFT_61067 [Calocera viscosa TUFC12733]